MPARNGFRVPVTVKEFFAAFPLRVFGVQDFDPSAAFTIRDVGCRPELGNDPFQIEIADAPIKRDPGAVNVIRVLHWGVCGHLRQQPAKLLFTILKLLRIVRPCHGGPKDRKRKSTDPRDGITGL